MFSNSSFQKYSFYSFVLIISIIYVVGSNCVQFGHYIDDIKWVLLAERLLKCSFHASWSCATEVELMNWGTSVLLSPIIAMFGRNIFIIQVYSTFALLCGLLLFFVGTSKGMTIWQRYVYLCLLTLNGFVFSFLGSVISESFFILLFGLFIYLAFGRGWIQLENTTHTILLGTVTGLLLLTRSVGIVMFACVLLIMMRGGRWRRLLLYAGCALMMYAPYLFVSLRYSGDIA